MIDGERPDRGSDTRRRSIVTVVIALVLGACREPPQEIVASAFDALMRGDRDGALARVDEHYLDALGGRAELEQDLDRLLQESGRIEIRTSEISIVEGATKLQVKVIGRLEVALIGKPEWRATGPLEIDLRESKIASGFLTGLRDVRQLAARRRAALEGNDPALYADLLHPTYRDGDVDREATETRLRRDLASVRIRLEPSLYKLEIRGALAHLDEYYALVVNERPLPPAV